MMALAKFIRKVFYGKPWLKCYIIISLLTPLLAGQYPLMVINQGVTKFPAFESSPYVQLSDSGQVLKAAIDWRFTEIEFKIMPIVGYAPDQLDWVNDNFVSPIGNQYHLLSDGTKAPLPWRYRHWLGTTRNGRDVLAILIHGCRTSLLIGFLSVLLAAGISLLFGMFAGYYGNQGWRIHKMNKWIFLIMLFLATFYSNQIARLLNIDKGCKFLIPPAIFLAICFLFYKFTTWFTNKIYGLRSSHPSTVIPIDTLLTTLTTTLIALPRLLLILVIAAFVQPSVYGLIIIIGLTSWTEPYMLIRSEMKRLRSMLFMDQAAVLGMKNYKVLFHHALPNLSVIIRNIFFVGIASAMLTETGLSFIGIGLPGNASSWGLLIAEGRRNPSAWWLIVVPGLLMIFLIKELFESSNTNDSKIN